MSADVRAEAYDLANTISAALDRLGPLIHHGLRDALRPVEREEFASDFLKDWWGGIGLLAGVLLYGEIVTPADWEVPTDFRLGFGLDEEEP